MQVGPLLLYRFRDRPDVEAGVDWVVEGRSDGSSELVYWNAEKLGPRPTDADLAALELPAAKHYKKRELRRAHDAEYRRMFEMDGEFMESERDWLLIREFRQGLLNLSAPEKAKADQRQTIRTKQLSLVEQVGAAQTVKAVEAVSWDSVFPLNR